MSIEGNDESGGFEWTVPMPVFPLKARVKQHAHRSGASPLCVRQSYVSGDIEP